MLFDKKWIKPLALALSLPSTAFLTGAGLMKMADEGYFSRKTGIIIFLAIIGNILLSMVIYAIRNNKKN